jgi:hypothetical protein
MDIPELLPFCDIANSFHLCCIISNKNNYTAKSYLSHHQSTEQTFNNQVCKTKQFTVLYVLYANAFSSSYA